MAKLYFYYSAMNAGKSTMLLQTAYNYKERGMNALLFIPAIDDRKAKGIISSRLGVKGEGHPFDSDFDFLTLVKENLKTKLEKIHCILVDEAQFLTRKQVTQLAKLVDSYHIPVLTYGLRTDFQGELFEGSNALLAWADQLTEVKTMCHCGKKAIMNIRVDKQGNKLKEGPQIQIGGNAMYIPACRLHYNQGKVKLMIDSSQTT